MGQKAGHFYRVKNKEQGREYRKYVIGWGHTVKLAWGENEQGNKYRVGFVFQNWLLDILHVLSSRAFRVTQVLSKFWCDVMVPWARAAPSWA